MHSPYLSFGAISTKVRAMYGRLLRADDCAKLRELRTTPEIIAFLAQTPGWGEAFSDAFAPRDTASAVARMNEVIKSEYKRLYSFGSTFVKKSMVFAVYHAEYSAIRFALAHICGREGYASAAPYVLPPLSEKSRARLSDIATAPTIVDLTAATDGTIYAEVLRSLHRNETGLPIYSEADRALERRYYSRVYALLTKDGAANRLLTSRLALEADLINIGIILRLHRHFKDSLPNYQKFMLPVRGRLTGALARELSEAENEAAAVKLLMSTSWKKYYGEAADADGTLDLEAVAERAMTRFCSGIITLSKPGPYFPQIYLCLREIERDKLTRAMVAADYGISPGEVL